MVMNGAAQLRAKVGAMTGYASIPQVILSTTASEMMNSERPGYLLPSETHNGIMKGLLGSSHRIDRSFRASCQHVSLQKGRLCHNRASFL